MIVDDCTRATSITQYHQGKLVSLPLQHYAQSISSKHPRQCARKRTNDTYGQPSYCELSRDRRASLHKTYVLRILLRHVLSFFGTVDSNRVNARHWRAWLGTPSPQPRYECSIDHAASDAIVHLVRSEAGRQTLTPYKVFMF